MTVIAYNPRIDRSLGAVRMNLPGVTAKGQRCDFTGSPLGPTTVRLQATIRRNIKTSGWRWGFFLQCCVRISIFSILIPI